MKVPTYLTLAATAVLVPVTIVLSDRDGQQLINTRSGYGASLPDIGRQRRLASG
ncbi:hypothetical protein ACFQUU_09390 [Herbaspirillum sp. GCM10030257]|uniref:hypothetical protein n=1 Tax=Herbaspirillum sp. GCM10030257 TaxID=3273393 RepID=UPI00361E5397